MKNFSIFILVVAIGLSLGYGSPELHAADDIIHDG